MRASAVIAAAGLLFCCFAAAAALETTAVGETRASAAQVLAAITAAGLSFSLSVVAAETTVRAADQSKS